MTLVPQCIATRRRIISPISHGDQEARRRERGEVEQDRQVNDTPLISAISEYFTICPPNVSLWTCALMLRPPGAGRGDGDELSWSSVDGALEIVPQTVSVLSIRPRKLSLSTTTKSDTESGGGRGGGGWKTAEWHLWKRLRAEVQFHTWMLISSTRK